MGRPPKYSTEEERREALLASYRKYNRSHAAEKAAHHKVYSRREDVKARRRELYALRRDAARRQFGLCETCQRPLHPPPTE